jgi:hypothetical protein
MAQPVAGYSRHRHQGEPADERLSLDLASVSDIPFSNSRIFLPLSWIFTGLMLVATVSVGR